MALARERVRGPPARHQPLVADPPGEPVGEGQHDGRRRERDGQVDGAGRLAHPHPTHDVGDDLAGDARRKGEDEHGQEEPASEDRENEKGTCQRQDHGGIEAIGHFGTYHDPQGHQDDARDHEQRA